MGICSSQVLCLSQWFCFVLNIGLGSSHSATRCKVLENCFYLCPGLASVWPYWFCWLLLWGVFFSPKEWQMVNLSPISFDEQCVLFWSLLFIFMLFIGLAAGFIISNYNNFQVHWDKSFPTWRGDFWLAVRESARGGVVTPHQLESESAVGNQAALTCSECVNRLSLCQA